MKNFKLALLLLLVFCAGAAVGVVGTRTAARLRFSKAITEPEHVQNVVERNLAWKLHLDKAQRQKVHEILTDSRGRLRELRQQIQPQSALVLSNANARIAEILTPEQQARFEEFRKSNFLLQRPPRPPGAGKNIEPSPPRR